MKSLLFARARACLPLALVTSLGLTSLALAQDQTVSGNLSVTGDADISGNTLSVGTRTDSTTMPGLNLLYADAASPTIYFNATRSGANWLWQSNTSTPQFQLSNVNVLSLFNPNTGVVGVTLNPAGTSSFSGAVIVSGNLQANGGFSLPTGTTATQGLTFGGDTDLYRAATGLLRTDTAFQVGGNLTIPSGNIGIGTTNPGAKLEVQGNAIFGSSAAGTTFKLSGKGGLSYNWNLDTSLLAGLSLKSESSLGGQLVILDNGNVGIGTTSPAASLEVANAAGANAVIKVSTVYGGNPQVMLNRGGSATDEKIWDFLSGTNAFSARAVNDANTFASSWIDVTRNGLTISKVVFPNGNVGVGTTTPSAKLEVTGDAKVSGVLSVKTAIRVPASGDLSMGGFTTGNNPAN